MKRKNIHNPVLLIIILILGMSFACNKQASIINPLAKTTTVVGSEPGYYYPSVMSTYPTGTVPRNTKAIIVFNMPIDSATLTSPNISVNGSSLGTMTEGVQYTITQPVATVATITFIGGASPLPANEIVTIAYTSGIQDDDRNIGLSNPGNFSFTTSVAVDTTAPSVTTINPSGTGIPLDTPNIYVEFNEDLDPVTLNSSTVYVNGGGYTVETTYSYSAVTDRLTLTPTSVLSPGITYTITVKKTGSVLIKDLSGNEMTGADQTQTFTTTGTPYDPYAGSPSIIPPGPAISGVSGTSATITWITDQPTDHIFRYGRSDAVSEPTITETDYSPFHAASLSGLSAGKRYWIAMGTADYEDTAGNAGSNSFSGIRFNTVTPETPVDIHTGTGGQYQVYSIPQKFLVTNSGAFLFWHSNPSSGNVHIYGQLLDYNLNKQWTDPNPVFTESGQTFTYSASSEDEEGGVIVAVYRGGDLYSKRVTSAGAIFNWGTSSDQDTDPGILIRSGVTNVSVVPVYTGIVQRIRTGVTEMAHLSWGAYVYDHDDIFSSAAIVDNDIIMDETNHDGATLTKTTQDHTYFIQQSTGSIASGNTYYIADGTGSTALSPSTNHDMNVLPDYIITAPSDWMYSPHNVTLAGWETVGDIIQAGTSYARIITAPAEVAVNNIETTVTANRDVYRGLYDGAGTPFASASIGAGDLVKNTTSGNYAHITTKISSNELYLDADIFSTASQGYAVYDLVEPTSGTLSGSADIPNRMYRSGATVVASGDYVRNTTTPSSFVTITAESGQDLTLSTDIFSTTTENYSIWDATPLPVAGDYTGSPTSVFLNSLICTGKTWTSTVASGDLVYNPNTPAFATVSTVVSDTWLTLSSHIFTNTTDTFYIFKRIETGTANSVIPYKLYRSGATWTSYGFTAGQDIVERIANSYAIMQTPISDTEITLDTSLFGATSQNYSLYKWISTATANSSVPYHMNRVGASWQSVVATGDLIRNITDTTFATVTAINTNEDMELSADIFNATFDNYEIYHNYCTTHAGSASIQPFYTLQANWAINTTGTIAFSLYNYRAITGTADTEPANPLYDNTGDFLGGTAVAAGDIVINYSDLSNPNNPNVATVSTGSYAIHAKALDMAHAGSGMFADNEDYEIIRLRNSNTDSSHIIDAGVATGTSAGHLIDGSTSFTGAPVVQIGDIVYNVTDDTYASVKTVAANNLTLSRDIFVSGERYVIIRRKGVFYIWQEGGNINGRIISMGPSGSAPVDLRAVYTIVAGSSPKAISDSWGSVLLVYVDGSGFIQARKINGNGVTTVGPLRIDSTGTAESIIDVQSDGANGAVILFKYSNNLYVQRINNNCAVQWGADGYTVEDEIADVTSQEVMVYDSVNDDVVVAANVGNDIKARRVGTTTSWAWQFICDESNVQQRPAIFLNGADTLIFWDDDRFYSGTYFTMGYGVFGVKINALTGVKDAAWNANNGGTADSNGISIVLNYLQLGWPYVKFIPYNNGAGAIMTWEDYMPAQSNNLVYINPLTAGLPWPE